MHSQTFQLPVGSFHVRPVQRNVFQPVLQFYDIDQRFSVFLLVFLINIKILAGIIYVFPGKTLLLQKFTLERIQIQENIIMLFDMLSSMIRINSSRYFPSGRIARITSSSMISSKHPGLTIAPEDLLQALKPLPHALVIIRRKYDTFLMLFSNNSFPEPL